MYGLCLFLHKRTLSNFAVGNKIMLPFFRCIDPSLLFFPLRIFSLAPSLARESRLAFFHSTFAGRERSPPPPSMWGSMILCPVFLVPSPLAFRPNATAMTTVQVGPWKRDHACNFTLLIRLRRANRYFPKCSFNYAKRIEKCSPRTT